MQYLARVWSVFQMNVLLMNALLFFKNLGFQGHHSCHSCLEKSKLGQKEQWYYGDIWNIKILKKKLYDLCWNLIWRYRKRHVLKWNASYDLETYRRPGCKMGWSTRRRRVRGSLLDFIEPRKACTWYMPVLVRALFMEGAVTGPFLNEISMFSEFFSKQSHRLLLRHEIKASFFSSANRCMHLGAETWWESHKLKKKKDMGVLGFLC